MMTSQRWAPKSFERSRLPAERTCSQASSEVSRRTVRRACSQIRRLSRWRTADCAGQRKPSIPWDRPARSTDRYCRRLLRLCGFPVDHHHGARQEPQLSANGATQIVHHRLLWFKGGAQPLNACELAAGTFAFFAALVRPHVLRTAAGSTAASAAAMLANVARAIAATPNPNLAQAINRQIQ